MSQAPPASAPLTTFGGRESLLSETPNASANQTNIRLAFILAAVIALSASIAQGPVLDMFLYELGGEKNSLVGLAESVWGITALVVAMPVGWIVDKYDRPRLMKYGAVLGLLAIATTIVAVYARSIGLVYFSFVVYGIFYEISSSAGEALFADSVPQGERSRIFTNKAMLTTISAGVGPGLTFVSLLLTDTNRWSTEIVSMVLVIGNLMLIPALGAMFFFRNPTTETDAAAEAEEEKGPDAPAPAASGACSRFLRPAAVPYIICSADFVTCIGAGMTVKFFNLFFIKDYKFTDADINILQCVYPAVIAGAMGILQRISQVLGRAQTSCASFALNATFFLVLWKAQSLPLLVVIFLIRGGLANGTAPLDRSILMDYVPSEHRGRWNAVESFTGATWSGSAFLGGWLSDSHDYRYTFFITAFIYYSASAVYLPLLAIVPRKEGPAARDVNAEASTSASSPVEI